MHFSTVGKYIRRSPYQAMTAISIMSLTFFMISVFSLLTILSLRLISYFETSPQLTIFFKDEAKTEEIMEMKKQFENTGKVANIKYVSKEDAAHIYNEIVAGGNPILQELVTPDILPASLEIQALKAENLGELALMVKSSQIIDEIAYQKDVIEKFVLWMNAFRSIGFAIIVALVFTSVLVILTIIAFKILVRREEIEIMRLLGATNWFIRTPFIIEGIFYGFFGALLGWTLALGILAYGTPFIQTSLSGIPIFPIPPILLAQVLVGEILIACFLGAFASFVAVLRYLK